MTRGVRKDHSVHFLGHGKRVHGAVARKAEARVRHVIKGLPPWLRDGPHHIQLGTHIVDGLGLTYQEKGPKDATFLDLRTTHDLAGFNGPEAQAEAEVTLIHELVHSRQRLNIPGWRSEAEAELSARKLEHRRTGYVPGPGNPYQRYIERLRREHGDGSFRFAKSEIEKGAFVEAKRGSDRRVSQMSTPALERMVGNGMAHGDLRAAGQRVLMERRSKARSGRARTKRRGR